jgi:hypothetical protein
MTEQEKGAVPFESAPQGETSTADSTLGLQRARAIHILQILCLDFIKALELEAAGVRDGEGYWIGTDPLHHYASEIAQAYQALREIQASEVAR